MGLLAKSEKIELMEKLTREKKAYFEMMDRTCRDAIDRNISLPRVNKFVNTGIEGFDKLMDRGIPKGSATLICGGPGSGKTIFGMQTLINSAKKGEKCFYMSFEERVDRLREHMHDFGWNPEELEEKGLLTIQRFDPYEVTRSVEALLEKAKGELLIDVAPVVFPEGVNPDRVIVDSLSSIGAAFDQRKDAYRIYVEQLFKLFERMKVTSFFISEISEDLLDKGGSAVEQFLADNVIIIYNMKKQNIRESAIEILKMRGAKFQKRIVAMQILSDVGIQVYPEQKLYGEVK